MLCLNGKWRNTFVSPFLTSNELKGTEPHGIHTSIFSLRKRIASGVYVKMHRGLFLETKLRKRRREVYMTQPRPLQCWTDEKRSHRLVSWLTGFQGEKPHVVLMGGACACFLYNWRLWSSAEVQLFSSPSPSRNARWDSCAVTRDLSPAIPIWIPFHPSFLSWPGNFPDCVVWLSGKKLYCIA